LKLRELGLASVAAAALAVATPASAVPSLQLDILGGTYDTSTETIMASGNSFSLYAYGRSSGSQAVSLADNFYLSMALVPITTIPGSYGSFKINGTTINVTGDMTLGTPPIETIFALIGGSDPGDLPSHGIFATYYAQTTFSFSAGTQSGLYNTQDHPGWGPQAGTGMYFKEFEVDVSGLAAGLGIHFDLYNETICGKAKGQCDQAGDVDVNKFAPFSHDAQGMVTSIPEPETYAMLLAGLGLLGFAVRRRKQKELAA